MDSLLSSVRLSLYWLYSPIFLKFPATQQTGMAFASVVLVITYGVTVRVGPDCAGLQPRILYRPLALLSAGFEEAVLRVNPFRTRHTKSALPLRPALANQLHD